VNRYLLVNQKQKVNRVQAENQSELVSQNNEETLKDAARRFIEENHDAKVNHGHLENRTHEVNHHDLATLESKVSRGARVNQSSEASQHPIEIQNMSAKMGETKNLFLLN
jgi:hypothetical protein